MAAGDAGDFDVFDELLHPDVVIHAPRGLSTASIEAEKAVWKEALTAMPDLRHAVKEVNVDGDVEMARVVVTGTMTAGFAGVDGTGRSEFPSRTRLLALALHSESNRCNGGVLEELGAVIEKLCEADPVALADGATIQCLHRQLARFAAVTTRASAAFDTGGEWAEDGGRSAAAWITAKCRVPEGVARKELRLGRALHHLPATESAWLGGDIGEAQVTAIVAARTEATEEAMDRDEAMLAGQATALTYKHFVRVLDYWHQHADPDGSEDDAAAQKARRAFRLSQSFDGMWFGDLRLDPISGAIVANQLRRIEAEMFAADWAEAKERFGDLTFTVADLVRTPAQRRADALVEMAKRAGIAPADGRRPEPLFSVFVGYETLAGRICQMADGAVVSPGSLLDYLDTAWIERVVFDGPSRVMDLGAATRLFTGATRRAIELRDRECFHELCDIPAKRCEVDHIEPWSATGQTIQKNGRLACGFHNRARHRKRKPPPPPPP